MLLRGRRDDRETRIRKPRPRPLLQRPGRVTPEANPNGSRNNIAGICNEAGNVFGLMPHPERACDPLLGSTDGRAIFASILATPASL